MADQPPQLHCPPEVARWVPESLAREYKFCPLDHVEGRFTIAVAKYLTDAARDAVQVVLGEPVCEVIHPAEMIFAAISEAYAPGAQSECSVYYRRERHDIAEDGTITVRTS